MRAFSALQTLEPAGWPEVARFVSSFAWPYRIGAGILSCTMVLLTAGPLLKHVCVHHSDSAHGEMCEMDRRDAPPPATENEHCAHHADNGVAVIPTVPVLGMQCCVVSSVSPEPARAPALEAAAKLAPRAAASTFGLDPPHRPPHNVLWLEREPNRGHQPSRFLVNSVFLC